MNRANEEDEKIRPVRAWENVSSADKKMSKKSMRLSSDGWIRPLNSHDWIRLSGGRIRQSNVAKTAARIQQSIFMEVRNYA